MKIRDVSFLEPSLINSLNLCSLKKYKREISFSNSRSNNAREERAVVQATSNDTIGDEFCAALRVAHDKSLVKAIDQYLGGLDSLNWLSVDAITSINRQTTDSSESASGFMYKSAIDLETYKADYDTLTTEVANLKADIMEMETDIGRCQSFVSTMANTDHIKFRYLLERMNFARQSSVPSQIKHAQNEYQARVEELTLSLKETVCNRRQLLEEEIRQLKRQHAFLDESTQVFTRMIYGRDTAYHDVSDSATTNALWLNDNAILTAQIDQFQHSTIASIEELTKKIREITFESPILSEEKIHEVHHDVPGSFSSFGSSNGHLQNFLTEAAASMGESFNHALMAMSRKYGCLDQLRKLSAAGQQQTTCHINEHILRIEELQQRCLDIRANKENARRSFILHTEKKLDESVATETVTIQQRLRILNKLKNNFQNAHSFASSR